jgi:cell shape-determining protein MreC
MMAMTICVVLLLLFELLLKRPLFLASFSFVLDHLILAVSQLSGSFLPPIFQKISSLTRPTSTVTRLPIQHRVGLADVVLGNRALRAAVAKYRFPSVTCSLIAFASGLISTSN